MLSISVQDIRDAWISERPLNDTDTTLEGLIGRAQRYINGRVPKLDEYIATGKTDIATVRDIVIDIVIDVLMTRERVRTVQESNGPTSASVTIAGDSLGKFSLTREQLKMLGVPLGAGTRRAGTVATWR